MPSPVTLAAVHCAGSRMLDAETARPVLRDDFARRVLGTEGLAAFEPFRRFRHANGANIARDKIIDDALKERFKGRPQRRTLVIGAGLDTRPFRMKTGEWVELDQPSVLLWKERALPRAECPVPLDRVPLDPTGRDLRARLAPFATKDRVTLLLEGMTPYLDDARLAAMARTFIELFPDHSLICDLMTRKFVRRYGRRFCGPLEAAGTRVTWAVDDPRQVFLAQGYEWFGAASIAQRAAELGTIPMRPWVVPLLPGLRDGYAVHVFKPA